MRFEQVKKYWQVYNWILTIRSHNQLLTSGVYQDEPRRIAAIKKARKKLIGYIRSVKD